MFITLTVILSSLTGSLSLNLFHEGSRITYRPESSAEYFGYSVTLNKYGLIVGAPKASWSRNPSIKTGAVFNCSIHNYRVKDVKCRVIETSSRLNMFSNQRRKSAPVDFFKDDMWFGAVFLILSDGKLMINAPRWLSYYHDKYLLAHGASYLRTVAGRDKVVDLLSEDRFQSFKPNITREQYTDYGDRLNYYAYGQAGFSAKANKDNTIIFGAPGLLQWAGGIISFSYMPDARNLFLTPQPIANSYFTEDIGPDEYLGYSVESGVFQKSGLLSYVAGAPRSKLANGQVFVFDPPTHELRPLNLLVKIEGPQAGAYFGGSLCCTDIDGDGLDDLLVGAPMYVKKDGSLPYDQGAVFIYMTQKTSQSSRIVMKSAGQVAGSESNGARFGTAIADLGDIDGDGFTDIAVGAPWENGRGAVYIYRGSSQGLRKTHSQRIEPRDARGFGISISKGLDIDYNGCNDLAVGAFNSERVYLYRSILTMEVSVAIKVIDAVHLQNTTKFTASFCVTSKPAPSWQHLLMNLTGILTVDPEGNRTLQSYTTHVMSILPARVVCMRQIIDVKPTADLSKPIRVIFDVEPVDNIEDNDTSYISAARLSDDSLTSTSIYVQLERDCGEDMVCRPWFILQLDALDDPYIPGSIRRFGVKVKVTNIDEPAYGAKVIISLPFEPKRLPPDCSSKSLNITCDIPSPLNRNDKVEWEINMDYNLPSKYDSRYIIRANVTDPMGRKVTEDPVKELLIQVTPIASITISGDSLPNATLTILRDTFNAARNYTFKHYYQIKNHGPSDGAPLKAWINLPEKVNLASPIQGCKHELRPIICVWSVPAKTSLPIVLHLRFDLKEHGQFFENTTIYNVTTSILIQLKESNVTKEISTILTLEPADVWLFWTVIIGAIIIGLVVLALIIYSLTRFGFFIRQKREDMKHLMNANLNQRDSAAETSDQESKN